MFRLSTGGLPGPKIAVAITPGHYLSWLDSYLYCLIENATGGKKTYFVVGIYSSVSVHGIWKVSGHRRHAYESATRSKVA